MRILCLGFSSAHTCLRRYSLLNVQHSVSRIDLSVGITRLLFLKASRRVLPHFVRTCSRSGYRTQLQISVSDRVVICACELLAIKSSFLAYVQDTDGDADRAPSPEPIDERLFVGKWGSNLIRNLDWMVRRLFRRPALCLPCVSPLPLSSLSLRLWLSSGALLRQARSGTFEVPTASRCALCKPP